MRLVLFKIQGKMVISILHIGRVLEIFFGGGQLSPGALLVAVAVAVSVPVPVPVPVPVLVLVLVHSKKNASLRLTSSIIHT